MKLRILDHSVRLRLRRGDLRALLATGRVIATTRLGSRTLRYGIELQEDRDSIDCLGEPDTVIVRLPATAAHAWAHGDNVAIRHRLDHDGITLAILIEKDFPCAHVDADALADTFSPTALRL